MTQEHIPVTVTTILNGQQIASTSTKGAIVTLLNGNGLQSIVNGPPEEILPMLLYTVCIIINNSSKEGRKDRNFNQFIGSLNETWILMQDKHEEKENNENSLKHKIQSIFNIK